MSTSWLSTKSSQQEVLFSHVAVDALVIDGVLPVFAPLPVENSRDSRISVPRPLVADLSNLVHDVITNGFGACRTGIFDFAKANDEIGA